MCSYLIERVYRYLDSLKSLQRTCRRKNYIRPYTSERSHDLEAAILTLALLNKLSNHRNGRRIVPTIIVAGVIPFVTFAALRPVALIWNPC
jgi:hypothetical protein